MITPIIAVWTDLQLVLGAIYRTDSISNVHNANTTPPLLPYSYFYPTVIIKS